MSKQQINLYTHLAHPIRSNLDVKKFFMIIGGFSIFLICFFILTTIQTTFAGRRADAAVAKQETARVDLMTLVAKYPQSSMAERSLAPSKLAECRVKFSSFLEQAAKAILPGVWLTEISISNSGKNIILKGNALRAVAAEQYLELLKAQPLFVNRDLELQDLSDVTQPNNNPDLATEFTTFNLIAKAPDAHG